MRALVVGLGHMGRFHHKVLSDLGYHVFSVDPDPGAGADYLSLREARMMREFDVACISCPAERLGDCAFDMAGTPMLVEKPFATNLRDAELLRAYLESKGSAVAVGFVERFNPHVRDLRERLRCSVEIAGAHFTRWSVRSSWDVGLDLLIHDVDLAYCLGVDSATVSYDARADMSLTIRRIEVDVLMMGSVMERETIRADLLAHRQSPLHALWHAFLSGGDYPRPSDAIRAHGALQALAHVEAGEGTRGAAATAISARGRATDGHA